MRTFGRPRPPRLLLAVLAIAVVSTAAPASGVPGPVRWVPSLPVQPQGFLSLDLFPGGEGYVMRANGRDLLFLSTADMGLTYQPATPPPFAGTGQVDFASADLGYGFDGGAALYRTEDAAASWEVLPSPTVDGASMDVYAARARVGSDVVSVGGQVGDAAAVAVSADRGRSWDSVPLGYDGTVWRTVFADADRGLVLGSRAGSGWIAHVVHLVERDDRGVLRAREILDCAPADACLSVAMTEDALFVGDRNGTLYRSRDDGVTFTAVDLGGLAPATDLPGSTWVEAVEFADEEVGYAATAGHGVWRTVDGGATWERETSSQDVFGIAVGGLAVADADYALAGGRNAVIRREPG